MTSSSPTWIEPALRDEAELLGYSIIDPSTVISTHLTEVLKARLVVGGEMANDHMTLRLETRSTDPALAERAGEAVRDITKLRGAIEMVAPGSLPNDGKVIEDIRSYQ